MTDSTPRESIEDRLAALTRWEGDTGDVWRNATTAASARADARSFRLSPFRAGRRTALLAASVLLLAVVGFVAVSPLEHSRRGATGLSFGSGERLSDVPFVPLGRDGLARSAPATALSTTEAPPARLSIDPGVVEVPVLRAVRRTARIELSVEDVPAAVARVTALIDEARGEYVQESSLAGPAESMTATITLRIAAGRLAEALAELREVGELVGESLGAEDVTAQIVDLDARLRNERRVEAELLELLVTRQNAPLKEIMEVRASLASVREAIERLDAQSQGLRRLVELATLRVTLSANNAPAPIAKPSLGAVLSLAWRDGVAALTDSVAFLVRIIVGGVVWWALLLCAGIVVWRLIRRLDRF